MLLKYTHAVCISGLKEILVTLRYLVYNYSAMMHLKIVREKDMNIVIVYFMLIPKGRTGTLQNDSTLNFVSALPNLT